MKKIMILVLVGLLLCGALASCGDAEETESKDVESVSIDEFSEAIWPEGGEGNAFDVRVPYGHVIRSIYLNGFLDGYDSDRKIVVMICFASMIPENYLDTLMHEGMSAAEYYQKYEELQETNPEEAQEAYTQYYHLRLRYYREMLDSLSYPGEKRVRGGACSNNFAFYACMTKEELLSLTCEEDEALYVFAAHYK